MSKSVNEQKRAQALSVFLIGGAALLFLVSLCVFFVYEGEKALTQRFGRIYTDSGGKAYEYGPGLHFIVPFIDQVVRLDTRRQILSVPSDRIYTSEQKTVTVDYYAVWRVVDSNAFYLKLRADYGRAEVFLRGKINDALRVEIGKREVNDVITGQRGDIIDSLLAKSQQAVQNLGIEILDVRISRVDYPQEVSESVFQRMQAAREKEAGMYRSEGDEESEVIRANGDAQRLTILAKANQESAQIKAEGDAQAAEIFNKVYSQNTEFFKLLRTLDVYQNALQKGETMLVDLKDSQLFSAIVSGQDALGRAQVSLPQPKMPHSAHGNAHTP